MTYPASLLAVWPRKSDPSCAQVIDRAHIDAATLADDEGKFLFANLHRHLGEFVDPREPEIVALFTASVGVDPAAVAQAQVRCWLLDEAQHDERHRAALLALLAIRRGAITAEHARALHA